MATMNFNTSNQTFRQLLGNGLSYRVPRFQRDYSWEEGEWDDLWQDIIGTLVPGGELAHYMGYLVLQTADNRVFDVIDGQQRLTTLSLLVLAILKNLQVLVDSGVEADNNRRRIDQLRQSYIGFLDPVSLVPQSKLTLNRNNDTYYQTFLVPLARLPQRNLKASEHLLRKAFEWFVEAVRKHQSGRQEGAELARLVDSLSDRLFFTVITVTDELNAYKVFETLNARGVRLSPTDLLKNYLFSVVHRSSGHETEMTALEQRWEAIVDKLGEESFPDFLRIHWNSRKSFVRLADLFKTIRTHVHDKGAVFQLLREMEEDADIYVALANPADSFWKPQQRGSISELRMFNVRQPYSLLLAARRSLDDDGFTRLLRVCSIISFRYNVISGLAPGEQERVYNAVAEKVGTGILTRDSEIIRALRAIYLSDESFRNAFAEKSLKTTLSRNKRVVRYLLFQLERQISGTEYDIGSELYSIEHVLPINPGAGWEQFADNEVERLTYRLGNLTLMASVLNRDLGNISFAAKREVYRTSEFAMTRQLAEENAEWNAERIAARQQRMARMATSIWRIDQLS
ncbi:MAG TPA: DUF262 domain-containing HNH endonuclease family protein [Candidatus Tectomicrobia bacterium]